MLRVKSSKMIIAAAFISAIAVSAGIYALNDRNMRSELLTQVYSAREKIDIETLKSLSGTIEDIDFPGYLKIVSVLEEIRSFRYNCRFAYLVGRKETDEFFFFADSEPSYSEDHSPPGQIYEEADKVYVKILTENRGMAIGPVEDRWGTWVSALVPIYDDITGEVIAVLGIDIEASMWRWEVFYRSLYFILLVFIFLGVYIVRVLSKNASDIYERQVSRIILGPMLVVLTILVAGLSFIVYSGYVDMMDSELIQLKNWVFTETIVDIDNKAAGMELTAQAIAKDPYTVSFLEQKDIQGLFDRWQNFFNEIKENHGISHFYFLSAERECLLRIHKPEKKGDIIDRKSALQAQKSGVSSSGVELGPIGTVTIRSVAPVLKNGTVMGYIELGTEIGEILQLRHEISGSHIAVTARKELLDRRLWESGMEMLGREANWDQLEESVLVFSTSDMIFGMVELPEEAHMHERDIVFGGENWRLFSTPFKNIRGDEIGSLSVLKNTTEKHISLKRTLAITIFSGTILSLFLGIFSLIILKGADNAVKKRVARTEELNRSLEAANQQLMAGEQQLRAMNQELEAREQQLVAGEKELEKKIKVLENMNRLMMEREIRVIEIKREVNFLLKELGREEKYKLGVGE